MCCPAAGARHSLDGVTTWTLFRGFVDDIQPDAGEWARVSA